MRRHPRTVQTGTAAWIAGVAGQELAGGGPLRHAKSNSDLFGGRAVETRGWLDRLVADQYHGHPCAYVRCRPHHGVADRISRWPSGWAYAAPAPQRPEPDAGNGPAGPETTRWRRKSASRPKCLPPARRSRVNDGSRLAPAADAVTLGDAVAAAVAPLQAVIERLSGELAAARAANEALRDQLAAAQSEAAELRGKSAANEAALEREVTDRRAVQQQADHSRREHQAAQERVAQAHVRLREQEARLQNTKTW